MVFEYDEHDLACIASTPCQKAYKLVTVKPPLRGHPRDKEKCRLNRGVPLTEVNTCRYKEYMSVNFAGPPNGGVPE